MMKTPMKFSMSRGVNLYRLRDPQLNHNGDKKLKFSKEHIII